MRAIVLLLGLLGSSDALAGRAQTRTVYLNKNGVTLTPGPSDSRMNRSSLVDAPVTIPRWDVSEEQWRDTITCLRELFVEFDVELTETDPGEVPHLEAVFGGSPELLGRKSESTGVSPFSQGCQVIERSIVVTFTSSTRTARGMCETMAHEIGHSYGLDHVMHASDAMSYLPYAGSRGFTNVLASCGETAERPCGLETGSTCRIKQNSYELLEERIGLAGAGDVEPPVVTLASHASPTLAPGFQLEANITDNVRVKFAWLLVDGIAVDTRADPPWVFDAPADLSPGPHLIEVKATDGANDTIAALDVTIEGDEEDAMLGCSVGDRSSGLVGLLLAVVLRRRRRSPTSIGSR